MNTTPLQRQYNPATYNELGIVKIGDGLFIDNAGELSLGFEVTATAGTGGSITPAGTTHVQAGGEITLYITPDENYYIDTVTINGVQEEEPANEYTFADLSENKIITVTFKERYFVFKNGTYHPDLTIEEKQTISEGMVGTYDVTTTINFTNHFVNQYRGDYGIETTIDLTNYTKMVVDVSNWNSEYAVMAVDFNWINASYAAQILISDSGKKELDISNFTGNHRITLNLVAGASYPDTSCSFNNWELI